MTLIAMLALGAAAGLFGGYLGIGGGVLLVPFFSEYLRHQGVDLDRATVMAASSSLLVTFVSAGSAAIARWRTREIISSAITPVLAGAVGGSLSGAWAASMIPGRTVRMIFVAFLVLTAMHLVTEKKPLDNDGDRIQIRPLSLIVLGVFAGFFSSLLGIGGGVMLVPMFVLVFHFPWEKASGTSSALASLTSFVGIVGYIMLSAHRIGSTGLAWQVVDWRNAIPVAAAAVATSQLGVRMSRRYGERVFRLPFMFLLLGIAGHMLFTAF